MNILVVSLSGTFFGLERERERVRKGFFFHWKGGFSSVCWFAVHILHCRLLIEKRTKQISVLLYEWTREKHTTEPEKERRASTGRDRDTETETEKQRDRKTGGETKKEILISRQMNEATTFKCQYEDETIRPISHTQLLDFTVQSY